MPQFSRYATRALCRRLGQDDHKFIAARPSEPVAFSDAAHGAIDEGAKQFLSGRKDGRVADVFEAVDVAGEDRQRVAITLRPRQFAWQVLHKVAEVVRTRRWIHMCQTQVLIESILRLSNAST